MVGQVELFDEGWGCLFCWLEEAVMVVRWLETSKDRSVEEFKFCKRRTGDRVGSSAGKWQRA
jgi:hypothetical protein